MKNIDFDIQNHETDPKFPFKLFYNANVPSQNHCHTEIEFIYVMTNGLDAYINGTCHSLKEGDIFMATCGDVHGISFSNDYRMVIQFKLDILEGKYMTNEDIYNMYEKLHTLERVSTKWLPETSVKIKDIFISLKNINSFELVRDRLKVLGLIYQLVCICLTELPDSMDMLENNHLMLNKKVMHTLEKLFIYIHDNYSKDISLESVASVMHYSPKYFSRMWSKYIGTSFHKYLNEYRINRATFLLKNTELTITDISYQTGFQSIKTFNRVFKSALGTSPGEYRQNVSKIGY